MAKPRSKANADLPRNLYAANGGASYRYRRADTGKCIGIGRNRAECIAAAIQANEILGLQDGVNLGAKWYGRNARMHFATNRERPDGQLFLIFKDLFPEETAKTVMKGWAHDSIEGRKYSGKRWIKTAKLDQERPANWIVRLYGNAKRNAERRGIPFEISVSDVIDLIQGSAGRCAVTGIRLRLDEVTEKHVRRPYAPSIDRIDSFSGYTVENCRLVCVAANIAMGQWGEEVLIEIAKGVARKRAFA